MKQVTHEEMQVFANKMLESAKDLLEKSGTLMPVFAMKYGEETKLMGVGNMDNDTKPAIFKFFRGMVEETKPDLVCFVTDTFFTKLPPNIKKEDVQTGSTAQIAAKFGTQRLEAIMVNVETPLERLSMMQEYTRTKEGETEKISFGELNQDFNMQMEGQGVMYPDLQTAGVVQ